MFTYTSGPWRIADNGLIITQEWTNDGIIHLYHSPSPMTKEDFEILRRDMNKNKTPERITRTEADMQCKGL